MATGALTRRFSAEDYARLIEAGVFGPDERLELIDGQVVVMTPQGPAHADVTTRIARRLERALGERAIVRHHSPLTVGPLDVPEPDLVVVPDASYRERHPRANECLLVVEVAQTSQAHDFAKAERYAAGGCPVNWLVDLAADAIVEHSAPAGRRYTRERVLGPEDMIAVPGAGEQTHLSVRALLGLTE